MADLPSVLSQCHAHSQGPGRPGRPGHPGRPFIQAQSQAADHHFVAETIGHRLGCAGDMVEIGMGGYDRAMLTYGNPRYQGPLMIH